jgi:hypothetical protein
MKWQPRARGPKQPQGGSGFAPPGLEQYESAYLQGLTPLAISFRPSGAGNANAGCYLPSRMRPFSGPMTQDEGLSASMNSRCDLAVIVYNVGLLKTPAF